MIRKLFSATFLALVFVSTCGVAFGQPREFSILYTNDIESVYEPITAFWDEDIDLIGGIPRLATLIRQRRQAVPVSFLVDAGDIFTGSLTKKTEGRLAFDIYSAMEYDAVNIGNHEFEYGWPVLHRVMQRARFAFLSANIFYANSNINFARQYTILERSGIRVGVIGVIGIDAFLNATLKANREGLTVREPLSVVQPIVDQIRSEVDFVVLLTHQNQTAPMQSNKEADPAVQRGYQEDYDLAGRVRGVDLIVGGHSDHGLWKPVRHPKSGTWIVQTFGQGKYLGEARFRLSDGDKLELLEGKLLPVDASKLARDPKVASLIDAARAKYPDLSRVVGTLSEPAYRQYNQESSLGNLLADVMKQAGEADLGMVGPGSIRTDLNPGPVTAEALLNVFPFTDQVTIVSLSGHDLRETLEYSLALHYGLAQFSGLELTYQSDAPVGQRLRSVSVNGEVLDLDKVYTLSTTAYNATGGDGYGMLARNQRRTLELGVGDAIVQFFEKQKRVSVPSLGRQVPLDKP